ncbi:LysM peptidoglycan-binding domain-containing protein [Microcella sp.]|uniref:LysM peptidoglycan-binding domain-containing protein n=1 Tax=Microcella sp. TaxID=1913979 RepID=UPI00391BE8A7
MIENDRTPGLTGADRGAAEVDDRARTVFAGLAPRATVPTTSPSALRVDLARRARSTAFTTVPVMLTGAIALSIGLTGPIEPAHARKPLPPKPEQSPTPLGLRSALSQIGAALIPGGLAAQSAATRTAPAVYTVAAGDTVSSIAQRFGISTASVLALNGLSWKSTIFPGQVLALTTAPVKTTSGAPATTRGGVYTIVKGDTLSAIAARFGVSTQSLLDANGLQWSSIVYPGQTIVIPGRVPAPTPAPAPAVGLAADVAVESPAPAADPVVAAAAPSSGTADTDEQTEAPRAPAVAAMTVASRPVLPVEPRRPAAAPRAPGGSSSAPPASPPSGGTITPLTSEMRTHASTIIQVGRQLGVPEYGIVIALATAMQESSLRNLSWGDRDSVGLFQQRPSSGWGTAADLQVPSHAAKLFYVGRSGYTRGLLDISGWQSMTLTRAAQAVQISAYPTAYAKWEASAWAWYFELT